MYETHVTIVGNALHIPEWRKTANTGAMVTTFKIASTARRLSKETGHWIDGNSLRVRVTCWRGLAYNVKESVTVGDPLIVAGRLYTRDWEDENGVKRTQYELEATSVGHDLSRGRAVFERRKANLSTSSVEDAQAQQRIGGELTEPVPEHEAPSQFNDLSFEEAAADRAAQARALGLAPAPEAAIGALRVGGFTAEPVSPSDGYPPGADPDALSPDALSPVIEDEPEPADPVEPDPLDDSAEPVGALVGEPTAEPPDEPVDERPDEPVDERGAGRRRGSRRSKVPV